MGWGEKPGNSPAKLRARVQRIRALIEPPMTAADRDKALSKLDELIDSLREPGVQR